MCTAVYTSRLERDRHDRQPDFAVMNFAFTEEQEELRKTVRAFLEAKSPETAVREQMETEDGFDPAVWSQMGEQMGLQGLHIPEEFGGSGYSYVELGIVLEEMGRRTAVRAVLLDRRAGRQHAAAVRRRRGEEDPPARHRQRRDDRHARLHRAVRQVGRGGHHDGGDGVGRRLHADRHEDVRDRRPHRRPDHRRRPHRQPASACSPSTATPPGSPAPPLSTMDQTRKQAKLEFADTPATLIGVEGNGWEVLSTVLDLAAVGLAAEQVGGAQKVLEMAVEYAKVRVQFGRPIGRSRRSSTSAPTCCSRSSRPSARPTTACGAPPR